MKKLYTNRIVLCLGLSFPLITYAASDASKNSPDLSKFGEIEYSDELGYPPNTMNRAENRSHTETAKNDSANSQASPFQASETRSMSYRGLSPEQVQSISSNSVAALKHIVEARSEIKRKNYRNAKQELVSAQTLLDVTRAEMPTFRIKDRINIARGHLNYETTDKVVADLVPIYNELTYVEDSQPTKTTQEHLRQAKHEMQAGNKISAQSELKLADESVAYSEIDLPLSNTDKQVKEAIHALNKHKPKLADSKLKEVEDNLQINLTTATARSVQPQSLSSS